MVMEIVRKTVVVTAVVQSITPGHYLGEHVVLGIKYVGDGEHQVGQDHQHVHHAGEG